MIAVANAAADARRRAAGRTIRHTALAAAAGLAACTGSGSDVGPRLDRMSGASHKVLVLAPDGAGVSAARVTAGGATAVSGRSGRGDLLANPTGRLLVAVDAAAATAHADDRLASLTFAAEVPGADLPFAVFLPDTAASASQPIAAPASVDDRATSGLQLLFAPGTIVADPAGGTDLRLAALGRHQLPGELPRAPAGAMLWSRGCLVDPPTATFAPPATLDLPDDMGAPSGAQLWRLDPITGEWTLQASTVTAAGGRLSADGISAGGLYAVGVAIAAVATVRGRVVDTVGNGLFGTLVRIDSTHTVADGGGNFAAVVAAQLADGSDRVVDVDLRGGALFLPVGRAITAAAAVTAGASVDLGNLALDTVFAGNLRFQLVTQGHVEPFRRFAHSSLDGATAGTAFADALGQCTLEEVPAGFFGSVNGHLLDRVEVLVATALSFNPAGRRWADERLFFDDRAWFNGGRASRTQVIDERGGGPVRDAVVVRGKTAGAGFSGRTRESGVLFVDRAFEGRATATMRTERDGGTTISAFSIERPNGDHLELPVRRRLRASGGEFERHGTIAGQWTGIVPSADHRVRAGRPREFDEWFDEVLLDVAPATSVPVRTGTPTAADFRVGVARPLGDVVAVEGTTTGGVFAPTGFAAAFDLDVAEGTAAARDIAYVRTFDTFTATQAFGNRDAALTAADFHYDLGLQLASGLVHDVARGIDGRLAEVGGDATIDLPQLSGPFAGGTWLVALTGRSADGSRAQRALLRLGTGPAAATPLLPVPTIAAPADGGTVAAAGFTVDFTLPPDTFYATIELANGGNEELHWLVVVPPTQSSFAFVALPTEAFSPLLAGRQYALTLTAYRVDEGDLLLQVDPYREMTTYWQAIGTGERGVRALSSRTIHITAN